MKKLPLRYMISYGTHPYIPHSFGVCNNDKLHLTASSEIDTLGASQYSFDDEDGSSIAIFGMYGSNNVVPFGCFLQAKNSKTPLTAELGDGLGCVFVGFDNWRPTNAGGAGKPRVSR